MRGASPRRAPKWRRISVSSAAARPASPWRAITLARPGFERLSRWKAATSISAGRHAGPLRRQDCRPSLCRRSTVVPGALFRRQHQMPGAAVPAARPDAGISKSAAVGCRGGSWPLARRRARPYYSQAVEGCANCRAPMITSRRTRGAGGWSHRRAALLPFDPRRMRSRASTSSARRPGSAAVYRDEIAQIHKVRCYLNANAVKLATAGRRAPGDGTPKSELLGGNRFRRHCAAVRPRCRRDRERAASPPFDAMSSAPGSATGTTSSAAISWTIPTCCRAATVILARGP